MMFPVFQEVSAETRCFWYFMPPTNSFTKYQAACLDEIEKENACGKIWHSAVKGLNALRII